MRALVIDSVARETAERILKYAESHHYLVGESAWVPGDDENFVGHFNDFRVVYSFSEAEGRTFRHLTVSVPGGLPNPIAVFMLAELFGFTGWDETKGMEPAKDWSINVGQNPPHIVVVQEIERVLN